MTTISVLAMVEQYLQACGYDGLYCPGECGCRLGNLAPCGCGEGVLQCEAGYLQPCDCGEEHDWHIGPGEGVSPNPVPGAGAVELRVSDVLPPVERVMLALATQQDGRMFLRAEMRRVLQALTVSEAARAQHVGQLFFRMAATVAAAEERGRAAGRMEAWRVLRKFCHEYVGDDRCDFYCVDEACRYADCPVLRVMMGGKA